MLSFVVGAGIAFFVLWAVSLQRRLVVLDENIHQAMNQIGVQLASRFDALIALLDLTGAYAAPECAALNEEVRTHRRVITATAAPTDVLQQEEVIAELCTTLLRLPINIRSLHKMRTMPKGCVQWTVMPG